MTITDIRYCFRTAIELGIAGHPLTEMEYFANLAGLKILKNQPITMADCWMFRLEGELPVTMTAHLIVLPEPYWKD